MASLWLLGLAISALALLYELSKIGRRPAGCPPGPPTLPLLGNLHLIPKKNVHMQYQKWAEEYGPVYSLVLGTQVMIVLTSDQAVKDLMDKRSNIYSSRPDMYVSKLIDGGNRMVTMAYNDTWRMIRKILHAALNVRISKSYVPYQELENNQLMCGLLDTPEDFWDHIRRYTFSLTTQMVYGFRTSTNDDPRLTRLYRGLEDWAAVSGSAGAGLLDLYPFLRVLPAFMLPAVRHARSLSKPERALYVGLWLQAKEAHRNKVLKPCFSADLVDAQDAQGFSDDLAGYMSGTLLEAGSDTTSNTLIGFVQAMLLYPEVQKKAREELDRVVGDRPPTLEDEPNLPYVHGCVKEALRWMPTILLGVPHCCTQEDKYLGYRIPKGAWVVMNIWGIHMDPKRHPNPQTFAPERYANDYQTAAESAVSADASQRDHFGFGAGRRICQGLHIAERSLFVSISRLLWGFTFDRATDDRGLEVVPCRDDFIEGFVSMPARFPAAVRPRSEKHAQIMRRGWDDCRALLDGEMQWAKVPESMKA